MREELKKINIKQFIIPTLLTVVAAVLVIAPSFFQTNVSKPNENINKFKPVVEIARDASRTAEKVNTIKPQKHSQKGSTNSETIEATARKVFQETIVQQIIQEDQKKEIVDLEINIGTSSYSYDVSWWQGMSAYDVLKKASEEHDFSLEASWYENFKSYYITGIHNAGCCWKYTINGEGAIGASLETVNANDVITWTHIN